MRALLASYWLIYTHVVHGQRTNDGMQRPQHLRSNTARNPASSASFPLNPSTGLSFTLHHRNKRTGKHYYQTPVLRPPSPQSLGTHAQAANEPRLGDIQSYPPGAVLRKTMFAERPQATHSRRSVVFPDAARGLCARRKSHDEGRA